MKQYVIGLDFGTLSLRGILVDVNTGEEMTQADAVYAHGVMEEALPDGTPLPRNYALQHPQDYLDALSYVTHALLAQSGVAPSDIIGMGMDFTACTLLPIDQEGVPLCFDSSLSSCPHAYVKLWKHHGAQKEAQQINDLAAARSEAWLPIYGGTVSCEWALPKILETLHEAPGVYEKTWRFIEAADWLSLYLTGEETHAAAFAGYKGFWNAESGYPSNDFMTALDPRLDGIVGSKISERVVGMDGIAGHLNKQGAALCGLNEGTALSLPMIDAHAAMPALNITGEGELMIIIGTSACHILNDKKGIKVKGICGYVKDGVIPSYYTYEAGQAAVGDIFDWYIKNALPARYEQEARERGISPHQLLREKAKALPIGESGVIALDWWNGNRSILVDPSLSGALFGLTLQTKPEEIYRALIESTAYGLRVIVEQYENSGIPIKSICAAGGIPKKDDMMMQIYADVLNRDIRVTGSSQAGALGSAIYASVAAGAYPALKDAAEVLSVPCEQIFAPCEQSVRKYEELYQTYRRLHDCFGNQNTSPLG